MVVKPGETLDRDVVQQKSEEKQLKKQQKYTPFEKQKSRICTSEKEERWDEIKNVRILNITRENTTVSCTKPANEPVCTFR